MSVMPSDPNKPRVSVLMAAHNVERYISEAVGSIVGQSFSDLELLVLDDASTDGTAGIVQRFAAVDDRVILIRADANLGRSRARNRLLSMAKGDFVAIMDADDVAMPERIARQVDFLERSPDHVAVGGQADWIDEVGRVIGLAPFPCDHASIDAENLRGRAVIYHPSALIRAEPFHRLGGYDENLLVAEDLDLWLRLAELGKLANLPETVLRYRLHDKSSQVSLAKEIVEAARMACWNAHVRRGIEDRFADNVADLFPISRSMTDVFLQRGWMAWHGGHRKTWRHYALAAVKSAPLSRATWTLLAIGALRRPVG